MELIFREYIWFVVWSACYNVLDHTRVAWPALPPILRSCVCVCACAPCCEKCVDDFRASHSSS